MTIHDAANLFLDALDPEHKRLILECAVDQHRSPASFILNCIKLVHDQGRTSQAIPESLDQFGPAVSPSVLQDAHVPMMAECKWCKKIFVPTRADQDYCTPPEDGSEPCARKAGLAEIRARRASKRPPPGMRDAIPPTTVRIAQRS